MKFSYDILLLHEKPLMEGRHEVMKRNGAKHQPNIMTLREVAGYLGLHVMTVYKLTREGRVPAAKIGGQWRFKRDVLDDWLEAQMQRTDKS